MAKQTKARFDAKGLTGLGIEKLVEILLEEASANKALKARLMAALAGSAGPEEIARLIDKRLDVLEQSRSRVNASKARELAVELLGLARNIVSELGDADALSATERLLRLISIYQGIMGRLREKSVKLEKSFNDAAAMALDLMAKLNEAQQLKVVPLLEAKRKKDTHYELANMFAAVLCALTPSAADQWKQMIAADATAAAKPERKSLAAIALLQTLAQHRNDLDSYAMLEELKPENQRDTLAIARKLHEAGRSQEALRWLLSTPKGMRMIEVNGMFVGVGPGFQARERKLLEAEIYDAMKDRDRAQTIRWREFMDSLDAQVLRAYISKLPDFAEFEELDKAFALVMSSEKLSAALEFLVEWPRLDLASDFVMRNAGKWSDVHFDWIDPAAEVLAQDYPVAATILYRSMIEDVLTHRTSADYVEGASFYLRLREIASRLPATLPFATHDSFLARLRKNHGRKYMFWNVVESAEFH